MEVLVQESHSQDLLIFLYKLYQERLLCDIEVESEDGVTFSTHRIVLASTSTYVHHVLLFKPGLSSLKLNVPSKVLQLLLEYGYTGQLFVSGDLRNDVEGAATMLQMYSVLDLLKKHCIEEQGDETVCDEVDPVLKADIIKGNHVDRTTNFEGCEVAIKVENLDTETAVIDSPFLNMGQFNSFISAKEVGEKIGNKHKKAVTKRKYKTEISQKNSRKKCSNEVKRSPSSRQKRVTQTRGDKLSDGNLRNTKNNLIPKNPSTKATKKRQSKKKSENSMFKGTTCVVKGDKKNPQNYLKNQQNRNQDKYRSCKNRSKSLIKVNQDQRNSANSLKIMLRCVFCTEKLPSSLLFYQHMLDCHSKIYLKLLYSRFLIKKSMHYIYGNNHSTLCTKFNKSGCCHLCGKKFDRYILFYLHIIRDHHRIDKRSWYSFLSLHLKNKFNTKSAMLIEKTAGLIQKKKFKCSSCCKQFVSKAGLNTHFKKIHVNTKNEDQKQKKAVISSKLWKCFLCNKGMQSEGGLRKHLEKTHNMSAEEAKRNQFELTDSIECEVTTCQFSSTNTLDMNQHVIALHPYIQHNCGMCTQVFKHKMMLERHMATTHLGRRKKVRPQCRTCGRTFPKAHNLRRHEHFRHGIVHESVREYRCDHEGCNFVTSTSTAVKLHKSKHTREKKFSCEFCGLKLKTEISHKKHINKMHLGIRPYLCQVCGQSFGEAHELKSHFSYKHTTDREYKCEHCGYATSVKSTYYTHLFNVHKIRDKDDRRKEYQCSLCPFKSILHHRYKLHLNSHSNTREYWCNICDKSFITSSTLLAHKQWMHSEKVFSCSQCEYETKTRQKLNEHIRVQHQLKGLRPYKCPYCEFRCATGGNTRKHVKQVHPGFAVQYHRDDSMLRAARVARATGHHEPLVFISKFDNTSQHGNTITPESGLKISQS